MKEKIDHPEHYNATIIKHLWRAGLKSGEPALDDLKKAAWYLAREIARVEKVRGSAFQKPARAAGQKWRHKIVGEGTIVELCSLGRWTVRLNDNTFRHVTEDDFEEGWEFVE